MDSNNLYSQQEFERIESYILGLMTEEEKLSFESELKIDQNLKTRYEDIKVLLQEVELASLKDSMEVFHAELKSSTPVGPINSKKPFTWKPLAVAASLLFLLAITLWVFLGNTNENEKLFTAYYQPDPGMVTAMGTNSNYEFDRGMVDYKTGDYQAAITRWEKLLAQKPHNDTLNYFLGSALLAVGDDKLALPFLQKTLETESGIFLKEASWYLGLAYLKSGNNAEALKYLQNSGREEAAEIIEKLK
ncbi:tetratricopeptide repeat protein [Aquiflexum gelatinilyticum]|uniref:tetratricopeptide repeat protein n=1 Tax=Aquiflexum gelatinilyticum TaxID=2961943 RepID=UPI002169C92B|nr:tetratricopeptide repeat protein [Aquiflexum gelatinilyticum]MCS4435755.1 tetratricopeptide repeat protein [Aquiflexum gelatinilyticum]